MGNFKFFTAFLFAFLFSVMGYGQEVLLNGGFESGIAKWKSYCDAAGTAPVDGVGGGVAGFAISASTTSPLAGKSSGIITKDAANRQGCGVASDFTLSNENKAKVLQIKIPYQVASGTYADDQYKVYVYDVDNSVLIEAAPTFIKNSTLVEQYRGVFQATLTGVNYRLIIHNASTSAVASTLRIEASVSSQPSAQGSFVGDWQSYTPTFTAFGTATNVQFEWRMVGSSLQIRGKWTSGTVTASEARVSLPNGMIPSSSVVTTIVPVGNWWQANPLVAPGAVMIEPSVSYVTFGSGSVGNNSFGKINANGMGGSSESYSLFAEIPISGRGSNSALSSEYSARSASVFATLSAFTHSSSGTLQVVTGWNTANPDSLGAFNASTGVFTCPFSAFYKVSAIVAYGVSTTGSRYLALRKNSTDVALGTQVNASNFGGGAPPNSTLVAGTQCNAGETLSIRAFQSSGGSLAFTAGTETNLSIWVDTGGTQVAASEKISVRYSTAAGLTVPNTTNTLVDYGTKDFDSCNCVTTGGAWKFTAPYSDYYKVSGMWTYTSTTYAGTSTFRAIPYKNGVPLARAWGSERTENGSSSSSPSRNYSDIIQLNAGETLSVYVYQDNGASENLESAVNSNWIAISN